MRDVTLNRYELGIYYVLIFLLLNEWLKPILILTKTGYYHLILIFIGLTLFLKWLDAPISISWFTRILYICWFIVYVYANTFFLTGEGLAFLIQVIQQNAASIFTFNLAQITDPFRTVLLFILIWMLIYLIQHWLVQRLNVFNFLLLTVVFITILDTFTDFDGTTSIEKIIVVGLIMSGLLFLKRLFIEKDMAVDYRKFLKMSYPIIIIVGCVSIVAIILPKANPQWPDPVPFIKSVTKTGNLSGNKNGVSKIGYDEDDSQLGGPFIGDDTVVFKVLDDKKQYWRIETKDIYTSKGWESSKVYGGINLYESGELIYSSLPTGEDEHVKTAKIYSADTNNYLIYPYGIRSVETNGTDNFIEVDPNIEKLKFNEKQGEYEVAYSTPTFKFSELTSGMKEQVDPMYYQLPQTLPQRVMDLAAEIVAGQNSDYEKARAIESYFRENGFRYDTKEVAVPDTYQDYVDQFLFETKVGYCDNFSTSMVVMLRSVGIPARWVKGFVTGDIVDSDNGKNIYEITNNEAHSWVEAYISGVGWVNFEPTIGFSNNRSIDFDMELDTPDEEMVEPEEETKPEQQLKEDENKKQQSHNKNFIEWIFTKKIILYVVLTILLLAGILLFLFRKRWMWKLKLRAIQKKPMNADNFEEHYLLLLKALEKKGIRRKNGQTLSAYAVYVDRILETKKMSELTAAYERFIYSRNQDVIDFSQMKEIWQYLVNFEVS